MNLSRIQELRRELEGEEIDYAGLAEIEEAFSHIPDDELPEPRENAMAADMLDELEKRISPVEKAIYEHILINYGESEANDPCYAISPLAERIDSIQVRFGAEDITLERFLSGEM